LGGLVLALSIRIGKSVLLYFDRDIHKIYLQIGLSACLFIGPLLYYYLKSVIKPITQLPKQWKWTLLGLLAFILIAGSIRPYHVYPKFWNGVLIKIIYGTWFLGVVATGYILVPIFKKRMSTSFSLTPSEKWLVAVYICNFLIAGAFFLAFFGFSNAYYISGPLVFSFFLYLAIFGYFYTDNTQFSEQKPVKKYANKKIESSEANELLSQLDALMQTGIHKDSKIKLKNVAEKLAIPAHRLSQLLNDNLGKSFNAYINEYRIEAACQLLETPHNLSLEGIGYEVGFNSKSTFFTTFKKIKRLTPAQYQQQIGIKNA